MQRRKAEHGEVKTSDREPVRKADSARSFSRQARKTKASNVAPPPMRGGIRL